MKKKELILDFTSLLDVIMILLFIVLSNISQMTEKESHRSKEELLAVESELEKVQDINEKTSSEMQELQALYDKLLDDYEYLKITSDYDANDTTVYEEAIKKTTRVMLICETGINESTGNQQVDVKIYTGYKEDAQQTYAKSMCIEHRFDLTGEAREIYIADQVTELTKVLSKVLEEDVNPIIWLSVQYAYDDENFSNTDLEIIKGAVDNLERVYSKACYIEQIKIY